MQQRRSSHLAAFTLIEVLLVCAILAVASAVTLPSFVRSIRGNRLRTAARAVVKAGRYARSMAVLEQNDMVLSFDVGGVGFRINRVRRGGDSGPAFAGGDVPDEPPDPDPDDDQPLIDEEGVEPDAQPVGSELISRKLDRVTIDYVSFEGGDDVGGLEGETVREAVYARNGMCTPYQVRLVDGDGAAILVSVDALGSAATEREP